MLAAEVRPKDQSSDQLEVFTKSFFSKRSVTRCFRVAVDQLGSRVVAREEKCWEKYDWLLIGRSSIISSLTWTNMILVLAQGSVPCQTDDETRFSFATLDRSVFNWTSFRHLRNKRSKLKENEQRARAREGEREQQKKETFRCVSYQDERAFSLLSQKRCWLDLTNEFQRYD